MKKISLLNTIIILSTCYRGVDPLTKAIEVFQQALDILIFVGNYDPQHLKTINILNVINIYVDIICMDVCNEFERLIKIHNKVLDSLKNFPDSTDYATNDNISHEAIEKLLKDVEA